MLGRKNDQVFFSLTDFKTLYKKKRTFYITMSSVVFLSTFVLFSASPVKYESEAKLKKASASEAPPQLRSFLSAIPFVNFQNSVVSCLKSQDFLRQVISETGGQIEVRQKGWFERKIANISTSVFPKKPSKNIEDKEFVFSDVVYKNYTTKKMTLRILNNAEFIIVDTEQKSEIKGKISEQVVLNDLVFTLDKIPQNVSFNKNFDVYVLPMYKVLESAKKNFLVKGDKEETDVLILKFQAISQEMPQRFLNVVLKKYIDFLKEENGKICDQQSQFLGKRKSLVEKNYADFLDEHADYLQNNLENDGFLGMHQQLMMFDKPNEEYNSRLYDVNLDISRLKSGKQSKVKDEVLDDDELYEKIKDNKRKEKNVNEFIIPIDASIETYMSCDLSEKAKYKSEFLAQTFSTVSNDLDKMIELKNESESILNIISKGNIDQFRKSTRSKSSKLINKYVDQITDLEKQISLVEEEEKISLIHQLQEKKSRFQEVLRDIILLAEAKKDDLLKKSFQEYTPESELAGINPETVQRLYIDYNHELDSVILNIKQLTYVKDQIYNSDVEVSSLSNLLTDPVSQNMIQKASQLAFELRDESNRSIKESERIKDSLLYQKQFLGNHIAQMIGAQKIKAKLIEDKIDSLQKVSVNILNNEKKLIEERLSDIRNKMSNSLPKKWKSENMLLLKKEIYSGIIENLAKMEESKIIDKNMKFSDYSVLDTPTYALFSQDKGLFIYPTLIAFLSFLSLYFFHFVKRISQGNPVSEELLEYMEIPSFSKVSMSAAQPLDNLNQKDFNSLRKFAHFIFDNKKSNSGIVASILGNAHVNFSVNLASVLTQKGANVLVIDTTKNEMGAESNIGLYAFLTGVIERPEIKKTEDADFISMGKTGRFFVECISQHKFKAFLDEQKEIYDFIIIHTLSEASSIESVIYQSLSDVCLISCDFNNSIQDFQNLLKWKESKNKDCLSFVLVES
ncbi:MAG: CpsD/CapB family tyrosine-protein kinase [Chlamydiae bacterium]|nr:CpsD/CapB family tyrosine-protein kinase [Chlamydiota bacterium]